MSLFKRIYSVFHFILDIIAPPDPLVRAIEDTGLEGIMNLSKRSDGVKTLSFFPYRTAIMKTALVEIKTRRNMKLTKLLAHATHEHLVEELSEMYLMKNFISPLLVPIPMTQKSVRARGWNQCELIAHEMNKKDLGNIFELRTDILFKHRDTEDQVGKNKRERFENLKNSFSVKNKNAVRGRNVIVLDDIVTTGATCNEAKRALVEAGARSILCLSVAY